MSDVPNIDEVRAHAKAILARAEEDSEFGERLRADPEATLREAGFEERAIPDFARALSDVEAHRACLDTCIYTPWTCLVTD